MHYVKLLTEEASSSLSDELVVCAYRFKKAMQRGDHRIGVGCPGEISALDILWQNYDKYDQIGHAWLALQLWGAVICHPETRVSIFRVGGSPNSDRGIDNNRELLKVAPDIKATLINGNHPESDGFLKVSPRFEHRKESFPLQIGAVCPANLLMNVIRGGGFARWPYGSSHVYVFDPPTRGGFDSIDILIESHFHACVECKERRNLEEK